MENSVLFIARHDSIITLRRYILIAGRLLNEGIDIRFIAIDPIAKSELIKQIQILKPHLNPDIIDFSSYRKKNDFLPFKPIKVKHSIDDHQPKKTNRLVKELKRAGFRHSIFSYFKLYKDFIHYQKQLKIAQTILDTINPACVIYDIEIVGATLAILDICKNMEIKIISLQHAEGFGRLYANFPPFADYYIAYSRYNVENIMRMGIRKNNIWLMGNPDTELESADSEIKEISAQDYILIALKPNNKKLYKKANKKLLKTVFKLAEHYNLPKIKIKIHPSDSFMKIRSQIISNFKDPLQKLDCEIIDGKQPLYRFLKKGILFISYDSFALIEAVIKNANVLCIHLKDDDNEIYPDWKSFSVMHTCRLDELESTLNKIFTNQTIIQTGKKERKNFANYFRGKNDSKASFRITQKVCRLIEDNRN